MSHLFSPLALGPVELPNRIVVSPMCQYSAADGSATDWHLQHLMQLAISRAGMIVVEATAVERTGRISHGCLGLYSDANEAALARVLDPARRVAAPGTRFAIQIGHAGRKASCQRPWEGGRPLTPRRGPVAHGRALGRPLHARRAGAAGPRRAGAGARHGRVLPGGGARGAPRLRGHRAARRARLSAARVPLAAVQPAQGRLRRQPREPHALSPGGGAGRARRRPAQRWRSAPASPAPIGRRAA